MARPLALVVLAALAPVCAVLSPVAAAAEEYREDPFRPSTTRDEERRLQDDERQRKAFRDMIPEIRAKLMEDIEAQRAANAEATKRAIIEALKADPAFAQRASAPGAGMPGIPGSPTAADVAALGQGASMSAPATRMEPTPLPEDAEFVACLNGKELYKDSKRHTRFIRDLPKGVANKCAVDRLPAMSAKRVDVVAAAGQALANGAAAVAGAPPAAGGVPLAAFTGGPPAAQPGAVPVPRPVLPVGMVPPPMAGVPVGARPPGVVVPGAVVPGPVPVPVASGAPAVTPSAARPVVPPPASAPRPAAPAGGGTQTAPGGPLDMSVGYRYPRPPGN